MTARKANETRVRALSGTLFIAVFLVLLWIGGLALYFAMLLTSLFCWYEADRLLSMLGIRSGFKTGVFFILAAFAILLSPLPYFVALPLLLWPLVQTKSRLQRVWQLGWFSLSLLPFLCLGMYALDHDFSTKKMLMLLIAIWLNDSLAYLGGRKFGRRKLAPLISPGKSWEGFFTGYLGTLIIMAFLVVFWWGGDFAKWMIFLALLLPLAVLGDLLESALKRQAGAKDSGRFLPGHGGWLDRFDSFLVSIPILYYLFAQI
jgi:phosphatidate cytidylyltransferase